MRVFFNGKMEDKKQAKSKPTRKGVYPSKQKLYAMAAKHSPKAIRKAAKLLDNSNPSVVLGAIKVILGKSVPDLRSQEITGKYGQLFPITILTGIDSTRKGFIPPSTRSITNGQPQIQSSGVAQTSKKDINSNKRSSKTSAP